MRGRAVVARRAHNPEVLGSNPSPATPHSHYHRWLFLFGSNPPFQGAGTAHDFFR